MYAATSSNPGLARLAQRQSGVVRRSQLRDVEASEMYVRHQIDQQRWTPLPRGLVLLQNAPPTRRQRMWIGLLDGGRTAALGSHTSLELHGFSCFAREAELIHVVTERGRRTAPMSDVIVHESRRLVRMPISVVDHLRCVDPVVSVIDAAAWQVHPRFAVSMVAAAVQQRFATVAQLDDALRIVGRVRHKNWMRLALLDIAGGAESLSEIDIARLCRDHRLRPPRRQQMRRDSSGRRRFLDCEWDTEWGITVLEIDGAHHMNAEHWSDDLKRERQIVIDGRRVLRCTAHEARAEQGQLSADLRRAGVPSI